MSTAPTVSSQPSIWRLGMVDWRFAFGVYAALVVGQFLINSTVSAIMYATSDDFSQHVDQAAVNAAFTTGIYLLITQIITTTTYLRAASLSGASRRTLALSTYVLSAVVIAIASVIWWVLALTQTHIFFLGSLEYPPRSGLVDHRRGRLDRLRRCRTPDRCGLATWSRPVDGRSRHYCCDCTGPSRHRWSGYLAGPHARSQVRLPSPDAPRLLAARPPHSRSCRRRMAPDPHRPPAPPQLNASCAWGT